MIKSKEEYETTKQRLDKGEAQLEGHWLNPNYKKFTDKWSGLLEEVLEFEILHKIPEEDCWGYK